MPTAFVSGSFEGNGHIAREALLHLAPLFGLTATFKSGAVPEIAADLIEQADYFILVVGANEPAIKTVQGDTLVESELDYAGAKGVPVVVVLLEVPEHLSIDKEGQVEDVPVRLPPFAMRLRSRMKNQYESEAIWLRTLCDLPVAQFGQSVLIRDDREALVQCAVELSRYIGDLDRHAIELVQPMSRYELGMRQLVQRFMRGIEEKHELLEMEPRAFEHFMLNLYRELGHQVMLTPESHDGGRDLELETEEGRFLIELKRWSAGRIGIKAIGRLERGMDDESDRGLVLTTSPDEVELRVREGHHRVRIGGPDQILYLIEAFRAGEIGAIMKDETLSSAVRTRVADDNRSGSSEVT